MTDAVSYRVENGVAWLTIERPEARNALNAAAREGRARVSGTTTMPEMGLLWMTCTTPGQWASRPMPPSSHLRPHAT